MVPNFALRHPRKWGPGPLAHCLAALGSRFRGNDDNKRRYHLLELISDS
jgi:hypothetical protein